MLHGGLREVGGVPSAGVVTVLGEAEVSKLLGRGRRNLRVSAQLLGRVRVRERVKRACGKRRRGRGREGEGEGEGVRAGVALLV